MDCLRALRRFADASLSRSSSIGDGLWRLWQSMVLECFARRSVSNWKWLACGEQEPRIHNWLACRARHSPVFIMGLYMFIT